MEHVYKYGGLYRIAVGGELRKRFPKHTMRFRVPYRTLLTGVTLDLVVLADLPPQARRARPFEVVANPHSTDTSVLGELVLLDWQIAMDGAWFANRQVYQPLGVWIYKRGAVVAACLKKTPRRPLKDWLNRAKEQGDPQLIERLSSRVRPPDVKQAGRLGSLQQGGVSVVTLTPTKTLYPFRDAPTERVESERVGDAAAEQRYKERLPPALRTACEAMDFGDLRRFIDDCLAGRIDDSEVDCPSSEEEFLGLLQMLQAKGGELTPLPDTLPDPGPPPSFPPRVPSERLQALRAEQRRLEAALRAAQDDPAATKQSISELRRKLEFSTAEVTALKAREKKEYRKRRDVHLHRYRKAKAAYKASVRRREEALREQRQGLRWRRVQIVERIERDIRRAFEFGAARPTRRLPWRLLPPGELSIERLRRHYQDLQRQNPHIRYDPQRIERAYSLGPQQCYVGTDEFDGYVVFTFARMERALLECPVYGNAIYVLGPDWKRLSRMSKGELLSGRSGGVTKIVHKGDWFRRAKLALGIR